MMVSLIMLTYIIMVVHDVDIKDITSDVNIVAHVNHDIIGQVNHCYDDMGGNGGVNSVYVDTVGHRDQLR